MLLSSSKLFRFLKEVHLNSVVTGLWHCSIGIALCYSHQVCCLLYYLGEIKSGIHMYQFTFKPSHFCFRMWSWFRIWAKILADRRIWRKKGTNRRICIPLFTPSVKKPQYPFSNMCRNFIVLNQENMRSKRVTTRPPTSTIETVYKKISQYF